MNILVTGAAGFIGFHLCKRLLDLNFNVIGIDNVNSYYDVSLKCNRLLALGIDSIIDEKHISSTLHEKFTFIKTDIFYKNSLASIFNNNHIDIVVNLAAQAGVRYSIENPDVYGDSNLTGFLNVLELCRHTNVKHLLFASSSSVYGLNSKQPFSESDNVDTPISLYAATKKANELMAHTYSHLYGMQTTGVRFFTVYGPWGRPDMALFKFTKSVINGTPVTLYNNGEMYRDFTYIDDIINGLMNIINKTDFTNKYNIYNIGKGEPVKLDRFLKAIENSLQKKAIVQYEPLQDGDVVSTFSDISKLQKEIGYSPTTSVEDGVDSFVQWYLKYLEDNKRIAE